MLDIFKLIWDVVVLRDVADRGKLSWMIWPMGFGAVLVLYGTALPAFLVYDKHPTYLPLFLAVVAFDIVFLIGFLIWASRWQSRLAEARKRDDP